MKSFFKIITDGLAGVIIIGLLALIAYLFIKSILRLLIGIESDVVTAIVAASATILVSVFSLIVSKYLENKTRIKQEIRQKKIPVYEKQIDTFFNAMFSSKNSGKQFHDKQLQKEFVEFTKKLIIWGSEEVILEWYEFRKADWGKMEPEQMLAQFESLLTSIRKDVGNESSSLPPGVIVSLFINDSKS